MTDLEKLVFAQAYVMALRDEITADKREAETLRALWHADPTRPDEQVPEYLRLFAARRAAEVACQAVSLLRTGALAITHQVAAEAAAELRRD